MQSTGETIPAPISVKHYSGKFIIRIPPEVHRKLAIQAAESGVSLNRLASSKLSHSDTVTFLLVPYELSAMSHEL
jgi:predicted HicB family RNase H-like nuclease